MVQTKKVISPYSNLVRTQCVLNAHYDSSEINNIDYSSNVKDICKAHGKKCKRKLNRPKMRLHVAWHILKGHLIIRPDLCGFCGEGGCRLELREGSGDGAREGLVGSG